MRYKRYNAIVTLTINLVPFVRRKLLILAAAIAIFFCIVIALVWRCSSVRCSLVT
jgi:hypothetical protein